MNFDLSFLEVIKILFLFFGISTVVCFGVFFYIMCWNLPQLIITWSEERLEYSKKRYNEFTGAGNWALEGIGTSWHDASLKINIFNERCRANIVVSFSEADLLKMIESSEAVRSLLKESQR